MTLLPTGIMLRRQGYIVDVSYLETAPRLGAAGSPRLEVVDLADPAAQNPELAGGKASALASAAAAGLRTLPGFVISPPLLDALAEDRAAVPEALLRRLEQAWAQLSDDGDRPLIVRSSSVAEDRDDDAMAGRFASIPDVRGWSAFLDAVEAVTASRQDAGAAGDAPLAVLVQPMLDTAVGGVLFGLDPVSGREDRVVVSAVRGRPDRLVSGEVEGTRYELDPNGRVQARRRGEGGARLGGRTLRRLARLSARAAEVFGGSQDVEWAVDEAGRLWLLQSRPVTTPARGTPEGPVLGRGPVAETFPEPLHALERDLWLQPLREALTAALTTAGAVPRGLLDASPVATCVGGYAVVDLELLGAHRDPDFWDRLDPRPAVRRLNAAWRVGRLRSALPRLATDLLDRTDAELAAVPPVHELSVRQRLGLLRRARQALVALHAHEALVGMVLTPGAGAETGTSVALRVLAGARQDHLPDDEIVRRYPVVLTLAPPRVGARPVLPETPDPPTAAPAAGERDEMSLLREALRVRVRWVQELSARAAEELGRDLAAAGVLERADQVRDVRLDRLEAAVLTRRPMRRTEVEAQAPETVESLPAAFRLSDTGHAIPVDGRSDGAGTGAGGGRGGGRVHHGADPPAGSVLVVDVLDPAIAPVLDRLAALVAETGNPLAHLAILARQAGVPTVVGYRGAREEFPPGCHLEVDGETGEVRRLDDGEHEEDR